MKTLWHKLTIALIVSLFCHNHAQAISAENKALLEKIYSKAGQYGKYAVAGALTAEFGPSVAVAAAMIGVAKVIADNIAEDLKHEHTHSLKFIQNILRGATGGAFALGALCAGGGVLAYVIKRGGIVYPLLGATGGMTVRALMDMTDIPDFTHAYNAVENRLVVLLNED